ncbi:uncharacterized protein LOC106672831 [Cimex lectularius]|uniref:Uncharacterized protein n=1 Tax=Cimex lectularius TaxID=79782 RepID=A0A8I6S9G9_CIMLE|nr:uncharacterized protein LOC106672831 [Cimex lectularius]
MKGIEEDQSFEQILSDVRTVVSEQKLRDAKLNGLLSDEDVINRKLESTKCYQDTVNKLNEIVNQSNADIIDSLQKENCLIRYLEKENKVLQDLYEDQELALAVIIKKYEEHKSKLQLLSSRLFNHFQNMCSETIIDRNFKMKEMMEVMKNASTMDDVDLTFKIKCLHAENQHLRNILNINTCSQIGESEANE